ncbi:MAG: hypothetical protein B7Z14_09025 [Bosea sp. 32-68-6]|nr:MAG: hypothetical protein B7Z14_09025 [Bosea sp. 32-68-6]
MKRQESEIGFKFVARGGEGVERVSGRAAAAILGVANAADSQAASANAAASASERQAEAMKKAKAEAEQLTREAEDNARREIRAARAAADEKIKAAKAELVARRKTLAEERRNLAVKRSDDPFNEVRAQYTAESARAASRMKNARTFRDEAAGAIVDAPAAKRAEYQETIDHYDGVLKKLKEEKKIRDGLFRSANAVAIARRAADAETVKAAADAVDAQRRLIETEKLAGEESVIAAERAGKDTVAIAKDSGRQIVNAAKNAERQLVDSTDRAVDKQIVDYGRQVVAAETASSRIARYFANVKGAPSKLYETAFPTNDKGEGTGFASRPASPAWSPAPPAASATSPRTSSPRASSPSSARP